MMASLLKEIESQALNCIREKSFSSPAGIGPLTRLCEQLNASDFCSTRIPLTESSQFPTRKYPMMYTVHESNLMTMALFVLPEGSVLPLHDHPNMNILTKFLYGDLSMVAFDKGNPVDEQFNLFEGQEKVNFRWNEREDWSVHFTSPDDGNIHEILAHSPCAFLDILSPPYGDSRQITYYSRNESNNLRPLEEPPHWYVCGGERFF